MTVVLTNQSDLNGKLEAVATMLTWNGKHKLFCDTTRQFSAGTIDPKRDVQNYRFWNSGPDLPMWGPQGTVAVEASPHGER
jgi:hypothetical protein